MLCGISTDFPVLSPTPRQVAHVLLTRPPLRQTSVTFCLSPLDLHVLGTPPAFVLSQDQTLKLIFDSLSRILTFSFALTQKNSDCFQRRLLCTSNFHLVIILHCLVFKVQIPMEDLAILLISCRLLFQRRLLCYHIPNLLSIRIFVVF